MFDDHVVVIPVTVPKPKSDKREGERRAIKQIRVLWPSLTYSQRSEWVERFRHVYANNLVRTVEALSGFAINARRIDTF